MDIRNKLSFIAEIGGNHLGSLTRARQLVHQAARAGATHVKFQTFIPEQMVGNPEYVIPDGPWAGRKLLDLYRETCTPRAWHAELFELARSLGITPLSTPFHPDDVEFLETLDCPMYKISSFEITDLELISAAANTGKPMLISTGMATDAEIKAAFQASVEASSVTFLACTSDYPASPADARLFEWAPGTSWGLSDHTCGVGTACAAVALGATVIEKHFTIDRQGPDAAFSAEPHEFRQLVDACTQAHEAVFGTPNPDAQKTQKPLRRSLWWAHNLPAGHVVTREDIKSARPGDGLPPSKLPDLIGWQLTSDVKGGTPCRSIGSK